MTSVATSSRTLNFAIAGGPFTIDDEWRFHRGAMAIDNPCLPSVARQVVLHQI